jgi:hypothetical protein
MSKSNLVLSTSAALAAISAHAEVSANNELIISKSETEHRDAIKASLQNSAVEVKLRQNIPAMIPKMKVDKETLEDAWIRLASVNTTLTQGQTHDGGPESQGRGAGRLDGHHADSTVYDPLGTSGLQACYSNCHSACHGSRGWR